MSRFYQKVISLSKTPKDFRESPLLSETLPSTTIAVDPKTTVDVSLTTTVVDELTMAVDGYRFWQAEFNASLFPSSRVHRIERAQDALTDTEERVYDCLWGPKNTPEDKSRLAQIGYDRIAKAARITKRNAALIVERLIAKGFAALETPADPLHRRPSQYRVLGHKAALEELHRRGRHWVVRSGNGVLFVYPRTVVIQPTATVFTASPTTVVTATTLLDSQSASEGQRSSSALLEVCSRAGVALDTAAERTILKRCRAYDHTATDEEIAYFASVKIAQLGIGRRMGDLAELLMTAVPELFVEPAYELQQYRAGKAQPCAKPHIQTPRSLEG
jgi:hypothetical protein